MLEAKNTARALVRIGYDGRVHKYFRGPQARERYENEVRVLNFLEQAGCTFVPRLLECDDDTLYLVTSNAGCRVEHVSEAKRAKLFDKLESFGVRHEDAEVRNITYDERAGQFCIIDFEFASILEPGYPPLRKCVRWRIGRLGEMTDSDEVKGDTVRPEFASRVVWSASTDPGRFRKNNEDAFLSLILDGEGVFRLGKFGEAPLSQQDFVFAVSDGMGGANAGEFASRIAVEQITRLLPSSFRLAAGGFSLGFQDVLGELFEQIHSELTLLGTSYEELNGMGATLSLCWLRPGWMYFCSCRG